jgi:hypothetical protein
LHGDSIFALRVNWSDSTLPRSWTDDAELRRKAKIPDEIGFQSKIDLALEMIE